MALPKVVRDIMTPNITTIEHDAKLLDAVLMLRSSGFRHLPVVKDGQLVGLLSDRDVQRAAPSMFGEVSPEEYNRIFETTPVSRVMVKEPQTATVDMPIPEAVGIMHQNKYGALPVVDSGGRLAGIITTTDLLGLLHRVLSGS
ncbi:MAG: CBS domain-containing protein [Acidobacteria bacterium]|nr:CBS domain-containing protein [Acidobacteriota bacterium]